MKKLFVFFVFLFSIGLFSQSDADWGNCTSKVCSTVISFRKAKEYLEVDDVEKAQIWLYKTKNLHVQKEKDTIDFFINSLQSELFYYMEMFQFGTAEAEKSLDVALRLKDSLLIAEGFFFVGINQFELGNWERAEKNLKSSLRYFPKIRIGKRMTFTIEDEHIYNNLAQVKLKLKQIDSAFYYNQLAYENALLKNSKRGIPNTEQTFGQIYLEKKDLDSSRFYFKKSLESAKKSNYTDIELVDYGFLMMVESENPILQNNYLQQAKNLIKTEPVNSFFRRMFYEMALKSLKNSENDTEIIELQTKIIEIHNNRRLKNNNQIQNITSQYVNNEKQLFSAENDKLKKQRNITFLLIVTALLCIGILLLGLAVFRRKTKVEKRESQIRFESLMEGQETERKRIARELHDGLSGDLSAIKYRISELEESGIRNSEKRDLQKIIDMIDQSCSQVRRISHDLMPASIEEFGLIESLKQYTKRLNLAYPIDIDFQNFGIQSKMTKHHESTLYRIIQELLNNIIKHAEATQALVQINFHEDEISVSVEDNGKGFDPKATTEGIGLKNINARVKMLEGEFDIKSSEKGTYIYVLIHLKNINDD